MYEDKTFKLPLTGKEVTIKGFASYRVSTEIQRIINDGATAVASGSENDIKANITFDGNAQLDANKKAIELMTVSFDGSKDNIFDRIQELPEGDVDFLIESINKVTEGSKVKTTEKKS